MRSHMQGRKKVHQDIRNFFGAGSCDGQGPMEGIEPAPLIEPMEDVVLAPLEEPMEEVNPAPLLYTPTMSYFCRTLTPQLYQPQSPPWSSSSQPQSPPWSAPYQPQSPPWSVPTPRTPLTTRTWEREICTPESPLTTRPRSSLAWMNILPLTPFHLSISFSFKKERTPMSTH